MNEPDLVLASASPRRRELLELTGWSFTNRPADVDESRQQGEAPERYVLRLAETKARACLMTSPTQAIILAADTAVVDGQGILGKPKDPAEATRMLQSLRGHSHRVLTGLALLRPGDGRLVSDLCVTEVPMRGYRNEEIEAYVRSGDPLDKAGAYAIQNAGFHPVESLGGCYASVMGLPLCHLARSLRKLGLRPKADIPAGCQSALGYACPIFPDVLRGEMVV